MKSEPPIVQGPADGASVKEQPIADPTVMPADSGGASSSSSSPPPAAEAPKPAAEAKKENTLKDEEPMDPEIMIGEDGRFYKLDSRARPYVVDKSGS